MKIQKRNKSQSLVVASVLIILIVIVGVIILWNVFNPLVKSQSKEVNVNPLLNTLDLKEADLFVTGTLKIVVSRNSGEDKLDAIKFIFYDETGNSHTEVVNENLPLALETTTYIFSPFSDFGKVKQISAYPIINNQLGVESKIDPGKILSIPAGLVSWWRFNNNLFDDMTRNNGEVNGSVGFVSDSLGTCALFNSGYVDFSNDKSLDLTNGFAISFWINSSSSYGNILTKGNNYRVSLTDSEKINFSYSFSNSGNFNSALSSVSVADGKWHHIVITNLGIYVDGNLDSILNLGGSLENNNQNLIVGDGFNGELDELMIFNNSISAEQANGIFNSGRS